MTRQGSFFAEVVEQIAEVAISSPKSLIGMTQWSLSKLREYLVSQKIVAQISLDWLHTLLVRYGIHWRHTKTWKESNDPEFWPKYRRIRRLYRRRLRIREDSLERIPMNTVLPANGPLARLAGQDLASNLDPFLHVLEHPFYSSLRGTESLLESNYPSQSAPRHRQERSAF